MTKQFSSVDDLLEFAITKEEEAAQFYTELADRFGPTGMQKLFVDFAAEELKHKRKLEEAKVGRVLLSVQEKVVDLKISDYLVDVEPKADMTYQDALIIAMKREKASFRLYNDLAAATDREDVRAMMLSLANEEAKHKLNLEVEYDEKVLTEN